MSAHAQRRNFPTDTLPVHVYEEYAWYATGYRYPLVQSHIDTFLKGDTIVSRMGVVVDMLSGGAGGTERPRKLGAAPA